MDHILYAVGGAPFGLRRIETVAKQVAPDIPVIGLGPPGFFRHLAQEQHRQVGLQIVPFALLEFFQQLGSPGHEAGVVRLVAEETEHGLAELRPEKLLVLLMRELHVCPGRVGIQVVDERVKGVLGVCAVLAIAGPCRRTAVDVPHEDHFPHSGAWRGPLEWAAGGEGNHPAGFLAPAGVERSQCVLRHGDGEGLSGGDANSHVGDNALHAQLRVLCVDQASRKAAGVIALILDPYPHPAFGGLFDREFGKSELLRRAVLGHQVTPPADVGDEHSSGHGLVQIRDDPFPGELAAIGEPANRSIFARRRAKVGCRLAHSRHGDLLPRPLRQQQDRHPEKGKGLQ